MKRGAGGRPVLERKRRAGHDQRNGATRDDCETRDFEAKFAAKAERTGGGAGDHLGHGKEYAREFLPSS